MDMKNRDTNADEEETEVRAFTWKDTADSVFKYNIRKLYLWGVWPLPGSHLFHIYTAFVLAVGFGGLVQDLVCVYANWGDLQEVSMALHHNLSVGSGFVKLVFFVTRRRKLYALVRRTDQLVSAQKELCASDEGLTSLLKTSHRRAVRMSLFVFSYITAQACLWLITPLVAYPGQRKLPFVQLPHPESISIYLHILMYFTQSFASFLVTFLGVSIDCFFAVVMIHAAVQFRILNTRIKALRPDSSAPSETSIRKPEFHDDMYNQLCHYIQTHQRLLRYVRFLDSIMNPMAMTQFTFGVMVAGVTLFQASYSPSASTIFKCATWLPTPGSQVYLYCWGAHNIMEQGAEVSMSLYSSGWVEAPSHVKRAMRVAMCCSQRPLCLTAGRVYAINKATFISLMNAAYSYYALLTQVNGRD